MPRNHFFTARIWQTSAVRQTRHAFSINRLYRRLSAGRRRLPDYIIAGAQKAGTTSLWAYLNEHPRVERAITKEMHFFDNNYERGTQWYRLHFPLQRCEEPRARMEPSILTGESSAYYMLHPLAPQRIADTVPAAKIILLLRNPVDRAFSHYQLKLRRRQEFLSFEDAIDAEHERLAGEEEKIVQQPEYHSLSHDRHSYLARGRYLEQILRWQARFAPHQLLILESGEFFHRTADVYQQVLQFLGLPYFQPKQFGNRFPGRYHDRMTAAMRQKLVKYFAPFNEQLYAHLGSRFDWER
jgi:hypothetical protein